MELALLLIRVMLGGVFATAAILKLANLSAFRQNIGELSIPIRLAPAISLLVPIAELIIAAALVPLATAWVAGVAALILIVLFSAVLAANLLRGRHPSCSCFGQFSEEPIGWATLVRNGVIAGAASLLVAAGREDAGLSAFAWVTGVDDMTTVILGAVSVVSLLIGATVFWLLLNVMAQNGRILSRLEVLEGGDGARAMGTPINQSSPTFGLPVGMVAPSFSIPGIHGETLTLDAIRAQGKRVLLAFTDPGCGPCNTLLPDLGKWQRELSSTLSLSIISRGSAAENLLKSKEYGLTQVLLETEREVSGLYLAMATPSAVLVNADGTIASPLAMGPEEIRALVARSLSGSEFLENARQPINAPVQPAGEPCGQCGQHHSIPSVTAESRLGQFAPVFKLPDLAGNNINLEDYRGRETMLLFWNTGCGFCQRMLPELRAWETEKPDGAPALLIVSAGTSEANKAQGLNSPVVLDPNFSVGAAFGATGTPSAVLVDRDGKVASNVAVGKDAVLKLAYGS